MMNLIDSHCHIDFPDFDQDRDVVLTNAKLLGVDKIIVPAITYETWSRLLKVTRDNSQLEFALGLHPVFLDQHKPEHLDKLIAAATQHKPIAIGEIGLDFYLKELDKPQQLFYFEQQLIIAKELNLPVIIHNRKAHDECIALLTKYQLKGGVIHAFNGSLQQANKYSELNFLLGFGGMLTYERSRKLHVLLKAVPLTSIVLETDAPDMTVEKHRGERNSPEYLPDILSKAAILRTCSEQDLADITNQNWKRVFATKD